MRAGSVITDDLLNKKAIVENIERRLRTEKKIYKPFITFSREPGSGGRPVAELVAKRLGYKLYDKQLIEIISERMHELPSIMAHVDEHERTTIMDLVQNVFNPDYISDEEYFRILCEVILEIAEKGSAVILGRGANFITPNAYGLQVQIVAPYRVRVARAIKFEHYDFLKARETIRDVSSERQAFIKQYFGKDIYAPKYYDLTINTTFFTVEQAADLVIHAYSTKFPEGKIVR